MAPNAPSSTAADIHGYWPGSAAHSRTKSRGGALALGILILGAGVVLLGNRPTVPSVIHHNTQFPSSVAPPLAPAVTAPKFITANQFAVLSNDRANAINAAAAAMSISPRTLEDMHQEFRAISQADTAYRDRLVAGAFANSAQPDVRALIASVERLITADAQILAAPNVTSVTDVYNHYLDADANEKAAAVLLRKTLSS